MAATTPRRLPGFAYRSIDVGGGVHLNVAVAGSGAPLLFLHGYPETHLMWRDVAPHFADGRTVVLLDNRGYGDSDAPAPDESGAVYSKRTMADDVITVMRTLGFDRFDVAAHDRGARIAHRLVLDHPEAVGRLALIDIVPTRHALGNVDGPFADAYWHWFFLAAGGGVPEHLLMSDPEYWIRSTVDRLTGPGHTIDPAAIDEYVRVFTDARIAATCADYRAGAGIDLVHDDASWDAGRRIEVPTLALWGDHSFVGRGYDTMAVWRQYARDVRGSALPAGHFVPEEVPVQVVAELRAWFDHHAATASQPPGGATPAGRI
jgi:haloacetate dehalogenase